MFEPGSCRVVLLGQGYVGLPVAMRAVEVGFDVVGFDPDKGRVDRLCRGEAFIDDISDSQVASALATGRYRATSDAAALAGFDIAVVSVPTPLLDGIPDTRCVEQAALDLAPHLRPGCCVILESTTYPGTTEDVFVPLLEAGSGLRAVEDFMVGYSPERIDPSNPTWGFRNTPKVVAGLGDRATAVVEEFYSRLVDHVVPVKGVRAAELTKLLENTFRHVNIALVNELAMHCHDLGIDVWSVLDAAATKPFGFMRFTPGPGVGGHCVPIDPAYLSWKIRRSLGRPFHMVEMAYEVNDRMPAYVVERAVGILNRLRKPVNGSTILLIGLAYKANSRDCRHSPSAAVAQQLADRGATLRAIDPLVDACDVPTFVELVDCTDAEIASADLVIVLTDHDAIDWPLIGRYPERVLDARNRLSQHDVERL